MLEIFDSDRYAFIDLYYNDLHALERLPPYFNTPKFRDDPE
jgi:hypothetical protein